MRYHKEYSDGGLVDFFFGDPVKRRRKKQERQTKSAQKKFKRRSKRAGKKGTPTLGDGGTIPNYNLGGALGTMSQIMNLGQQGLNLYRGIQDIRDQNRAKKDPIYTQMGDGGMIYEKGGKLKMVEKDGKKVPFFLAKKGGQLGGGGGEADSDDALIVDGGRKYNVGGTFPDLSEPDGSGMRVVKDKPNDFLVRDAERLRDRNPDAYHDLAQDIIYMMVQNNMEGMLPEDAVYDPLNLNPDIVQQYLNARGYDRKRKLGRVLGGAAAAALPAYLAGDANTEGYYREGTSTQYEGSLPQYATRRDIKVGTGETMTPSLGDEGAFMIQTQPGSLPYQAVTTPTDRDAGQMNRLMFLLRRIMGDVYKGKRYE